MSQISDFTEQLEKRNLGLYEKFKNRISSQMDEESKTISLIIYNSGIRFSLDDIIELRSHWAWFVPLDYVGYEAGSVFIQGVNYYRTATTEIDRWSDS